MREIPLVSKKPKIEIGIAPSLRIRDDQTWGLHKKSLEKESDDRYIILSVNDDCEQTVTEEGEE